MVAKKQPVKKTAPPKKSAKPLHPLKVNYQSWDKAKVMEVICLRVATTALGLKAICTAGHQGHTLPDPITVREWLMLDAQLDSLYARAKSKQAEILEEELKEIADTPMLGTKTVTKPTGVEYVEGDMIEHRRLRIDTRKWLMAKLRPRQYGEKIEVSGNPAAPLVTANIPLPADPVEAAKAYKQLMDDASSV